ncbi:MAG: SLBB domain-containing protein [Deltaproteobacteria bacterium]|nr:SLBB domain-containing protein [Deltaproteobacteria bacterium]
MMNLTELRQRALAAIESTENREKTSLRERRQTPSQGRETTGVVLRNWGRNVGGSLYRYIAKADGYGALDRALGLGPNGLIEEIRRSGLRGRGGAGFLSATKWEVCRESKGEKKYVICNGSESDPLSLSGRTLLEQDVHSVLEGMMIGAYAVGASRGYVYVNVRHGRAVERLRQGIGELREAGILGQEVFDTEFRFEVELFEREGELVCGEETALISDLEGNGPVPYPRPPFPAQAGLRKMPTLVHNVETWANVPAILHKGAEYFREQGTERSKGTKLLTLCGEIRNPGLIEVPFGMSVREIVYGIGGGSRDGKEIKAVQVGGPTGGFLPADSMDIPLDYETLGEAGTIVGSGSIRVVAGEECMVGLAMEALDSIHRESCGRCVFGREGTRQLRDILRDISEGKGTARDLDFLVELGEGMRAGSMCGLGKTAPNPVLTTIRYFREEYESHLRSKGCPLSRCGN